MLTKSLASSEAFIVPSIFYILYNYYVVNEWCIYFAKKKHIELEGAWIEYD